MFSSDWILTFASGCWVSLVMLVSVMGFGHGVWYRECYCGWSNSVCVVGIFCSGDSTFIRFFALSF